MSPAQFWIPAVEMTHELHHVQKSETPSGKAARKLREERSRKTSQKLKEFISYKLQHKLETKLLDDQRTEYLKEKGGLIPIFNLKTYEKRFVLKQLEPQSFQSQKMEAKNFVSNLSFSKT